MRAPRRRGVADTRPCTTGRRSAQLPTSARSKRELLETRDARALFRGKSCASSGRDATARNPRVFEGSAGEGQNDLGNFPGRCRKFRGAIVAFKASVTRPGRPQENGSTSCQAFSQATSW